MCNLVMSASMTNSRRWLPMGSTFSKLLNIFDTPSVDDCPDSLCDYPEAHGGVTKTIDYQQLRDFRHDMWAKRRLGAVGEHDWFPGGGLGSSDGTAFPASRFSNHLRLCSAGTVFYEYHV